MSLLWINGALVDKADAKVSPFDHGFLYGDGVWEHLRVFGGKLFRPADHLKLLFSAAETLGIDTPLSRDELHAAIEATVKANNRTDGYVRVIVTRGPGTIGPDPRKLDPQVIIIAEEYQPFPLELYEYGLHAILSSFRLSTDDPVQGCRVLSHLHLVRAKAEALRRGCLEALFLNQLSEVVGATEGNLLAIKSGQVWLTNCGLYDLPERVLSDLVCGVGYTLTRGDPVTVSELLAADEVFIAGTSCGVIGIVRVDGKAIGSGTEGPVTRAIRERFRVLIRGGGG